MHVISCGCEIYEILEDPIERGSVTEPENRKLS